MMGLRGTHSQRRATAWLSLAAMLLITLAPAVPNVFDVPHCPPAVEELAMSSEEQRHHDTEHAASDGEVEHCAMCLLFGAPFGLIRPDVPVVPAGSVAHVAPAAPVPQVPVSRFRRSPAQPRAPPILTRPLNV